MPRMHWTSGTFEVSPERSAQIVQQPLLLDCAYQVDDADRWSMVVIVQLLDATIGTAECDAHAGLDDAALDGLVRDLLPQALANAAARLKEIQARFGDFARSLTP